MKIKKFKKGFSLIEMLISIALFAIVSVISTQSLANSLKNSRKSESLSKARENVDYALSTMERLLRNAQDLSCSADHKTLTYTDEYDSITTLSCNAAGKYIASGSSRLTSTDVNVYCNDATAYPFTCPAVPAGVPKTVTIIVKAEDANLGSGAEGAVVTSQTKVNLRYYVLD